MSCDFNAADPHHFPFALWLFRKALRQIMREIHANVQPLVLGRLVQSLMEIPGFPGMSVLDCDGFGLVLVDSRQSFDPFISRSASRSSSKMTWSIRWSGSLSVERIRGAREMGVSFCLMFWNRSRSEQERAIRGADPDLSRFSDAA